MAKVGGILLESQLFRSMLHVQVGVGVNVANPKPTVSINALIDAHNTQTESESERLPLLSVERLLAAFLKRFESELDRVLWNIQITCTLY